MLRAQSTWPQPLYNHDPYRSVVTHYSISTGFESLETVPAVFVFMGNFQSFSATSASTDYDAIKQNFSALAAVLQRHRRLVVSLCNLLK